MKARLALVVFIAFVAWLLARDCKRRDGVSQALWIPLAWFLVLGSRAVSMWFGLSASAEKMDDYLEGSPFDRLIFLGLIFAGIAVLVRRRVNVGKVVSQNTWLFIFYLFWTFSVMWSDYPFVSFKRLFKELGSVVMVLVVISELNPEQAISAILARFVAILIPMSVLLVKYFPDLGRSYNRWTWERMVTGVTTNKNSLGCLCYLSLLFIVWNWMTNKNKGIWLKEPKEKYVQIILLVMAIWLLSICNSATSLLCSILGIGILFVLRRPFFRVRMKSLEWFVAGGLLLLFIIDSILNVKSIFLDALGRDLTLTTRTDVWEVVLKYQQSYLVGSGYYSFWLGDRLMNVWNKYEGINQAHNGYLDIFLNGGIIGLFFLVMYIIKTGRKVKQEYLKNQLFGLFRLAIFYTVIIYNITEATFARLSTTWFAFLLVTISLPKRSLEPSGMLPGGSG